jgi:hypothetical protein
MSISRHLLGAAVLAPLVLIGSSGCGNARYIVQDSYGGVVAIPANTNSWPTNYRDEAEKLMKKKCPLGYVIDREEEVVVGQTTTRTATSDTRSYDLPGGRRPPSGELVTTTNNRSVSTHDQTEYRITFHSAVPPRVVMPASGVTPVSVRVAVPPPTPPGLPPTPVPIGN